MRIGEANSKDQFNTIKPVGVLKHFHQATAWLRHERHRRAAQHYWSIHNHLDHYGKATANKFDSMSHDKLNSILEFILTNDRFCTAGGEGWARAYALSMGGAFSAQAADLHSIWCFHVNRQHLYALGALQFSDSGYPLWVHDNGRMVSLAQLRDNTMVASASAGPRWAMSDVCAVLQSMRHLQVVCSCISKNVPHSLEQCMGYERYALGVGMRRHGSRGEVYVHPSSLNESCQLQQGAPLQSSWAVTETDELL